MSVQKTLKQAEINSIKRDISNKDENYIDLNTVNKIEEKANKLGYGLYKIKDVNQANFTQTITDNWDIIMRNNYLTSRELTFMMSIQSLIGFDSNAIIDKKTGNFLTVSEIAKYLKRERSGVSKTIKSLITKGILFEFVNVDEIREFDRNVTARTLFVNPELVYAGDRNRINSTLALLVSKYDKLEKKGIRLEWKVWKKPSEMYGKLYKRKTYLELKRNQKKKLKSFWS